MKLNLVFFIVFDQDKSQKLRLCGYGIKAIISAFQAEDVGSIPTTHTSRSTFQSSMEMGVSPPECEVYMQKARTATLSSNSQKDKTFPLNGKYAGSIPASVKRRALVCSVLLNGQEVGFSFLKYGFDSCTEYQ